MAMGVCERHPSGGFPRVAATASKSARNRRLFSACFGTPKGARLERADHEPNDLIAILGRTCIVSTLRSEGLEKLKKFAWSSAIVGIGIGTRLAGATPGCTLFTRRSSPPWHSELIRRACRSWFAAAAIAMVERRSIHKVRTTQY